MIMFEDHNLHTKKVLTMHGIIYTLVGLHKNALSLKMQCQTLRIT